MPNRLLNMSLACYLRSAAAFYHRFAPVVDVDFPSATAANDVVKRPNRCHFWYWPYRLNDATKLHALGLHTLGVSAHGRPAAGFEEVVTDANAHSRSKADILINALPLTSATKHFYNSEFFSGLQNQPLFINIGRGASVDTPALVQALQTQQLRAAALDVVDPEPLPQDSPLWDMDNVLLTPHISGTVPHLRDQVFKFLMITSILDSKRSVSQSPS